LPFRRFSHVLEAGYAGLLIAVDATGEIERLGWAGGCLAAYRLTI
jgi:hypothetical protein